MANESLVPVNTITLATHDEHGLPSMEDMTVVDYSPSEKSVVVECPALNDLQSQLAAEVARLREGLSSIDKTSRIDPTGEYLLVRVNRWDELMGELKEQTND